MVRLTINGKTTDVDVDPNTTLLAFLLVRLLLESRV